MRAAEAKEQQPRLGRNDTASLRDGVQERYSSLIGLSVLGDTFAMRPR
jgi:hypothetical protein